MADDVSQNSNENGNTPKPRNPMLEVVSMNRPGAQISQVNPKPTPTIDPIHPITETLKTPEKKIQETPSGTLGDQVKKAQIQASSPLNVEAEKNDIENQVKNNLDKPAVKPQEQAEVKPSTPEGQKPTIQTNSSEEKMVQKSQGQALKPGEMKAVPSQKGAPKKIGKEKKQPSKKGFLLGCAGGFLILFILFILLMVFMISSGGGAVNPIMQALNLSPGGLKAFLLWVIGFTFGSISLLLLVMGVVGLFKFLGAQKTDKIKRRYNAKLSLFSSLGMIFMLFIWFVLYSFVSRIEVADGVFAEIQIVEPDNIENLVAPIEIRFSAEEIYTDLIAGGAPIEAMSWDLDGDGEFETPIQSNLEVTQIYTKRSAFNVGLQVKIQGEEEFRVFTKLINIQDASFEATPASGLPPLEVQFDARDIVEGVDIKSLDWDFDGDGVFDLEGPDNFSPRYTYDKIGTYQVQLRVINTNNNVEDYKREIEVTNSDQPIVSGQIDVTPGLSGNAPLQLRFDAGNSSSLKGIVNDYEWDFGDGSNLQSGKSVSHIFNDPGIYNVTLRLQDDSGNEGQTSIQVEALGLSSEPEAVIITTPAAVLNEEVGVEVLTGTLPFVVSLDASKSVDEDGDIVDYQWDVDGDGVTDLEGERVEHVFETAGEFELALTVADTENQTSQSFLKVVVEEPGVQATIVAIPAEGTAPLTVNFDGASSTTFNGNIVQYTWDFGDGLPTSNIGATVSHRYDSVGTYTARLTVLTNNNESATETVTIFVREVPLKACFDTSRTTGEAPLTVSFDSRCSEGTIRAYNWQYGDGFDSESGSPTHTFEVPGTYTVTLEVTDDKNNVNSFVETIVVQ